ncbi:TPA: MBL fold metallo-hydrolase [Methanosarcinaceae archaeon]|nr:MBL fold metallo-hydrolase [Methanosarcinaceae archaeon]
MSPHVNVIPVHLKMTSAFIIREEGTILVDSGYPGSENAILEKLREIGGSPDDLRLIILTHGHADHAGSAAALQEKTGAKVAVHRMDADKVRKGIQGTLHPTCFSGQILGLFFGQKKSSRYPAFEPDILIDDSLELDEYGVRGKVIHTPGHSPGCVSILLDNGDAIVGDLIFPSIPLEKPSLPFWADDPAEARKSIKKLIEKTSGKIYIAHGKSYSSKEVKEGFRKLFESPAET